jgi:arginine/lysine/ornithine decarboxylase
MEQWETLQELFKNKLGVDDMKISKMMKDLYNDHNENFTDVEIKKLYNDIIEYIKNYNLWNQ